ncbi:hypothetical protein [Acinetobacter sp. TUM15113]|uniref:hypothetical protein n=1 Tax=Acinetobacter sp. TUM15113 TaxID=2609140 RepID=UPI00124D57FC|nr:hypothetical protein [Acinetobacter sp. TUM15113]
MHSVSAFFLQEHPIHGCIHDASNNLKPFPILAIDDVPLNQWINQNTKILERTDNLVPAQGWLYDFDNEHALSHAWALLKPNYCEYGPISTVVPILVCPDDLDLICSVIVVEQVVTATDVKWLRFGQAFGNIHDVVTSVIWQQPHITPELTFQFSQFKQTVCELKVLDKMWSNA